MEKAVNDEGKIVLIRTPWMQQVMTSTYNFVAIAALTRGSLDGAWEYEISEHLKRLWKNQKNQHLIQELLNETGAEGLQIQFEKAGYLITQSKIM